MSVISEIGSEIGEDEGVKGGITVKTDPATIPYHNPSSRTDDAPQPSSADGYSSGFTSGGSGTGPRSGGSKKVTSGGSEEEDYDDDDFDDDIPARAPSATHVLRQSGDVGEPIRSKSPQRSSERTESKSSSGKGGRSSGRDRLALSTIFKPVASNNEGKEDDLRRSGRKTRRGPGGAQPVDHGVHPSVAALMRVSAKLEKSNKKKSGESKVWTKSRTSELAKPIVKAPNMLKSTAASNAFVRQSMKQIKCTCKDPECLPDRPTGRCARSKKVYATKDERKNCRFRPKIKPLPSMYGGADGKGRENNFIHRMDADVRQRRDALSLTTEEEAYKAQVDKKRCPVCGTEQSYAEVKDKVTNCKGDMCAGATYVNRVEWRKIGEGFLTRLEADKSKRVQKAKKLDKAHKPTFRLEKKPVVQADETGRVMKVVEVEVPRRSWKEVSHGFLERMKEDADKRQEHKEKSEAGKVGSFLDCTFKPKTNVDKAPKAIRKAVEARGTFMDRTLDDIAARRQRVKEMEEEDSKPLFKRTAKALTLAAKMGSRLRARSAFGSKTARSRSSHRS